MKRETVTIDRKKLLDALNAVERALVEGNVEQALRQLEAVYRLIPPAPDNARRIVTRR